MIQEKLKSEYHKTKSIQAITTFQATKKYSQHSVPFGTDKANKKL